MATTYTLINSTTIGAGGATSIEFTSIPATYTDLTVVCSLRTTRSFAYDDPILQFNNNTSNYSYTVLRGTGSAASSYRASSTTFIYLGECNGDTSTASTFSNQSIYIPNYTSSSNKPISIASSQEDNTTAAYSDAIAGLWANSSAITSLKISIASSGASFKQYSSAYLYGISNA